MFADFVDFFGRDHFTNVTNGITARRWLLQCNPGLSTLITNKLGNDDWVLDLYKLKALEKFAKDSAFQKEWDAVKQANKDRLATYIEVNLGIPVNVGCGQRCWTASRADLPFLRQRHALFDVMSKRIHEYKRQFMNILGIIYRYLQLKKVSC